MSERTNDFASKAATAAIVGIGAAIIAAELVPALFVGVAGSFLPDLRRLFARTRCELLETSKGLLSPAPETDVPHHV